MIDLNRPLQKVTTWFTMASWWEYVLALSPSVVILGLYLLSYVLGKRKNKQFALEMLSKIAVPLNDYCDSFEKVTQEKERYQLVCRPSKEAPMRGTHAILEYLVPLTQKAEIPQSHCKDGGSPRKVSDKGRVITSIFQIHGRDLSCVENRCYRKQRREDHV